MAKIAKNTGGLLPRIRVPHKLRTFFSIAESWLVILKLIPEVLEFIKYIAYVLPGQPLNMVCSY